MLRNTHFFPQENNSFLQQKRTQLNSSELKGMFLSSRQDVKRGKWVSPLTSKTLQIQSPYQSMMIGVSNHLQNAKYFSVPLPCSGSVIWIPRGSYVSGDGRGFTSQETN